jgi:hypothetical protein
MVNKLERDHSLELAEDALNVAVWAAAGTLHLCWMEMAKSNVG